MHRMYLVIWASAGHSSCDAALESVWISGNLAIMVVLRVLFALEPGTAWCDLPSASDVVPPRHTDSSHAGNLLFS